ncbi:MAG: hypothetical protein Kow0054_21570 [Deferrisoma sp.]
MVRRPRPPGCGRIVLGDGLQAAAQSFPFRPSGPPPAPAAFWTPLLTPRKYCQIPVVATETRGWGTGGEPGAAPYLGAPSPRLDRFGRSGTSVTAAPSWRADNGMERRGEKGAALAPGRNQSPTRRRQYF